MATMATSTVLALDKEAAAVIGERQAASEAAHRKALRSILDKKVVASLETAAATLERDNAGGVLVNVRTAVEAELQRLRHRYNELVVETRELQLRANSQKFNAPEAGKVAQGKADQAAAEVAQLVEAIAMLKTWHADLADVARTMSMGKKLARKIVDTLRK